MKVAADGYMLENTPQRRKQNAREVTQYFGTGPVPGRRLMGVRRRD